MAEEPAVEVDNLHKSYRGALLRRGVEAVSALSFRIERGKVVGFLGPNGAGKTTTLLCLLGFISPTSGTVKIFGRQPGAMEILGRVGFVSEVFHAYRDSSPARLLAYCGRLSGMHKDVLEQRTGALLRRLSLQDDAERPIKKFSKGMVQRLGLAQALLHDPELLVLDEPTTGLDPAGRRLFVDLIRAYRDQGGTVLFSSHILSDVDRLCDEVIIIKKGEVVHCGGLKDLLAHGADLEDAYLNLVEGHEPKEG